MNPLKCQFMGFTIIETSLFEAMVARLESFARRFDSLCERHGEKRLGTLLGNEDVCRILQVSRRTMQDYRNNGIVPYVQVGGKILYRESEICRIVENGNRKAFREVLKICGNADFTMELFP